MLENLTKDYKKPCVLDLKMGTRMYGDFATDSKRKSQRNMATNPQVQSLELDSVDLKDLVFLTIVLRCLINILAEMLKLWAHK